MRPLDRKCWRVIAFTGLEEFHDGRKKPLGDDPIHGQIDGRISSEKFGESGFAGLSFHDGSIGWSFFAGRSLKSSSRSPLPPRVAGFSVHFGQAAKEVTLLSTVYGQTVVLSVPPEIC
ncbi:hypothetical protein [Mesorhizobium sp. M1E.F.Ca.ET.041.01.1.1]|uniref:hypothetical protein n=1 Tax=Mesorhizobium sp. M1E.F.Ca.ET.041.01.1.1 TaxID=2496759 RepID=UPI00167BA970|nr:hypothetical protein [Mesorhizobium sp. M1E.F.Ca.ET.041.01.1.1]